MEYIFNLVFGTLQWLAMAQPINNYYVDVIHGNDTNSGSIVAPFRSISRVNILNLLPGETVSFKAGQTFFGNLVITNSGKRYNPITFKTYGRGKAIIKGGDGDGILLRDCEYVTVTDIQTTGSGVSTLGITTNSGCGINVLSTSEVVGYRKGIIINDCSVIGYKWGIQIMADKGTVRGSQSTFRGYDSPRIINNDVSFCAHAGIRVMAQCTTSIDFIHKDIYIGNNYVHDLYGYNGTSYATSNYGTGILVNFATGGIVENNRVDNAGHSGSRWGYPANFEAENASDIIWQNNESSRCRMTGPDAIHDGAGFDVWDGDCQNMLVQYNYIHDNDGYGIGGGNPGLGSPNTGNVARFNLLVNNNKSGLVADIQIWAEQTGAKLYNNTIYSSLDGGKLIEMVNTPGVVFANNIFVSTATRKMGTIASSDVKLLNNLYWINSSSNSLGITIAGKTYNTLAALHAAGFEFYNSIKYGVTGDPSFNDPGNNDFNISNAGVGMGVNFTTITGNIGRKDFYNNSISNVNNIGAIQYFISD